MLRHVRTVALIGAGLVLWGSLAAQPMAVSTPQGHEVLTAAQKQVVIQFARTLADEARQNTPGATRTQVTVGDPDARLRLAPCQQAQAHLPPGSPASGRLRIGLRCVQGEASWSIHLPAHVQVFAPSLVASRNLSVGAQLAASDFSTSEVDLTADRSPTMDDPGRLIGRELQRPLASGEALRLSHLKPRLWFATGDAVKVVARGTGFQVVSLGQALNPGVDGQAARVRTENGRIVTGTATADRLVELPL